MTAFAAFTIFATFAAFTTFHPANPFPLEQIMIFFGYVCRLCGEKMAKAAKTAKVAKEDMADGVRLSLGSRFTVPPPGETRRDARGNGRACNDSLFRLSGFSERARGEASRCA